MKRQLLVAAIAAMVAGNAYGKLTTGSMRTTVINKSSKDVWMAWGGAQIGTKRPFYHLWTAQRAAKATWPNTNNNQFTTNHITSNEVFLRYYVCENGIPVQKETKHELEKLKHVIAIYDKGADISTTEEKE